MKQKSSPETNYKTIRSRLTGVVVVPSVVLLLMWALFSSYTVFDGFYQRAVASGVRDASIPAVDTLAKVQRERELSMASMGRPGLSKSELHDQQGRTDQALEVMQAAFAELATQAPEQIVERIRILDNLLAQLSIHRTQVESGRAQDKSEVYDYYNSVLDAGYALSNVQARIVPDPEAVQGALTASQYFQAVDWMSRATSVASGAIAAGGYAPGEYLEFAHLVGAYRAVLGSLAPSAEPRVREHYQDIVNGEAWKNLASLEDKLVANVQPPDRLVTLEEWQRASGPLVTELTTLVSDQATDVVDKAINAAESKFNTVLIGSLIALFAVIVGIALAMRISNRLVGKALITRLVDLKNDSLLLAHERLPNIVDRLRSGEHVDVEAEVPPLDYGRDEIGQVADAFNAAQFTAVAAAVKESQVREGVNRVFLDIAHRNQGLVHRQLKILDRLEREEESPEQLDALFQLDHLATRARRNAENLIILAGEKPGRQWRKPVRMTDILRAGVAETEQYVRVKVNPVPESALVGAAVADTIHLVAELVDNATAFSSPRSQVQVHSSEVPQGILVEIEDNGLGMSPEDRGRNNEMLANPPEFDTMSLRGESRLGLFVVARLADRRKIKVELRESPDGGTLALVLIPWGIVAGPTSSVEPAEPTEVSRWTTRDRRNDQTDSPKQADLLDDARFPEQSGDRLGDPSRGVDDFWAQAETDVAGHPRPTGFPLNHGVEISDQARDTRWPVEDPEVPGVEAGPDEAKPELPRRHRQQNLAPQLAHDDHDLPNAPVPGVEHDAERVAERSRLGLSAFQKGVREARRTDHVLEP